MPASLGVRSLNVGSPVNSLAPLNVGLAAWWMLLPRSPGGSTWHDLTGRYDAAGTAIGPSTATVGWGATRRPGGWGELRFGGATFAQPAQFPALDSATAFTVALWARQTTTNVQGYLLNKYSSGSNQIGLETWNDNNIYFEVNNGSISYLNLPTYTSFISAGVWFHLVAVFNGAGVTNAEKAQLYLNGAAMAASYSGTLPALTFAFVPSSLVSIGQHGLSTQRWVGAMDDVRIYSRALSAVDAEQLYTASRLGYPQELAWQPWPPAWASAVAGAATKAPPPRRQPWRIFRRAA